MEEYDSEEEEKAERFLGSGAAYYKMELKRGKSYTVWITGGSASDIELDVDTNWEYYDKDSKADKEPGAGFDFFDIDGGATKVAYMYGDDWDTDPEEGDPKSGKYIVYLSSDSIGATTHLHPPRHGSRPRRAVARERPLGRNRPYDRHLRNRCTHVADGSQFC